MKKAEFCRIGVLSLISPDRQLSGPPLGGSEGQRSRAIGCGSVEMDYRVPFVSTLPLSPVSVPLPSYSPSIRGILSWERLRL